MLAGIQAGAGLALYPGLIRNKGLAHTVLAYANLLKERRPTPLTNHIISPFVGRAWRAEPEVE